MCNICGQPDFIRCECVSTQPFCDQCANDSLCVEKVDSSCVIYHFKSQAPSQLINLGLPNGSSVEQILEAIDALIATTLNVTFTGQNSQSISWTPGGVAGHSPTANVIISTNIGNQLSLTPNGLYVANPNPNYLVKVSSLFAPGFLENKLVGDSDALGIIGITMINNAGVLKATPNINLTNLLNNFLDVNDTSTVDLSLVNGIPNILTAAVKVSATLGNTITVNPDGLYAPAPGGGISTADNGLTITGLNVQLGGPLVKNTLVSDYNFNLLFQTGTVQIGNLSTLAYTQPAPFNDDEGLKFQVYNRTPFAGNGASTSSLYGQYILEDAIDIVTNEHINYALNSGMLAMFKDSVTYTKDVQDAGIGASLGLGTDNTAIVNTGNPIAAIRANVFLIRGSDVGEVDSLLQGTIEDAASFYGGIPSKTSATALTNVPTITNFYGLYLDDSTLGSVTTKITNKYGVFQVGATTVNRFYGPVQNSASGVEFTSDERIKENIKPSYTGLDEIEQIDVITYDFRAFTGNPKKDVIGVVAQQLEKVLPKAISKTNMHGFDDFRMVNESYLIYTLINAVKQLSAEVKYLKSKLP